MFNASSNFQKKAIIVIIVTLSFYLLDYLFKYVLNLVYNKFISKFILKNIIFCIYKYEFVNIIFVYIFINFFQNLLSSPKYTFFELGYR